MKKVILVYNKVKYYNKKQGSDLYIRFGSSQIKYFVNEQNKNLKKKEHIGKASKALQLGSLKYQ